MPIVNRIAEFQDEAAEWRRHYHRHPELFFDVHRTARDVAGKLKSFGCDEVVEGIGRTGVVGIVRGAGPAAGRAVALRADMDALPIAEESGKPWSSTVAGRMHACGHDGHTTMLLVAARYLAETRRFSGMAVFVFQPAEEEGGGGGKAMIDDGLFERFGIGEIYGLHNLPGMPIGSFGIRPGPILAAGDRFALTIEGRGAHAARPHESIDSIVAGAAVVQAFQSIVARNVDPLASAVVSISTFQAGDTSNVLPQRVKITGTARSLDPSVRDLIERRMHEISRGIAESYGATADFQYVRKYPVTSNHLEQTKKAVVAARAVSGSAKVNTDFAPMMGGEDFSIMLEACPGAYIFIGNGSSAALHHPAYDFSDEAIAYGASYWTKLIENLMPANR